MVLPDTNLWIALAFDVHAHHQVAHAWRTAAEQEHLAFCRLTQQSFLRLITNPAVLGADTQTLDQAWQTYDRLQTHPSVTFLPEPVRVESTWRSLTRGASHSPKVWNDAYLAAFAACTPCQLVTFDRGFRKYRELDCRILEPQLPETS